MTWGFGMTWGGLALLYRLLPATTLPMRSTAMGAFVSAVLLGIGQGGLGVYLDGMQSIRLWGPVGPIPLFMFWVYVMWLVVLLGLQLASSLQHVSLGDPLEDMSEDEGPDDGQLADALEAVAERLRAGEVTADGDEARASS